MVRFRKTLYTAAIAAGIGFSVGSCVDVLQSPVAKHEPASSSAKAKVTKAPKPKAPAA